MNIFESASIGRITVKNRLIRSATYEGMCTPDGVPTERYGQLYEKLAANGSGTIITGFTYISRQGRALQPLQAGIDRDELIPVYREVTDSVHRHDGKLFMQLVHTGRQTRSSATGEPVVGICNKPVRYFREEPRELTTSELHHIGEQFTEAAQRAERAGFDGVQLHAAHGYLLHDLLLPSVNQRRDRYGMHSSGGCGTGLLDEIIAEIRRQCGSGFGILIKVSGGVDSGGFDEKRFSDLIAILGNKAVDGIEVSYGTMEYAFNIFRSTSFPLDDILDHDPVYRQKNGVKRLCWKLFTAPLLALRLKRFSPAYNLYFAHLARMHTKMPIISVGGFRTGRELQKAFSMGKADFLSMCRPFIAEPDFAEKLARNSEYQSLCTSCNRCVVTTGSPLPTICRRKASKERNDDT
jgi:2,4-dienoyl-CoA reductase-like NADH-dependent reductase (Old Yellow Enzyme family)